MIFRQLRDLNGFNMIQRINHAYPGSTNPIHLLPSNSLAITQPCSKPCAVELVEVETICQLFASTTKKTIRYMDSINYLWIYNDLYLYRYPSIQPNFHTVIQNSIFSLRSHVVSQFEDILSGRAKSSLPVQSHHRARAQPIREKSAISAKNTLEE